MRMQFLSRTLQRQEVPDNQATRLDECSVHSSSITAEDHRRR